VYKSVGAAFLDAATARLAYEAAVRLTVGTSFDFSL
jgi:ornithine cyclodeaminase/alanine dehydrogenase-like protein (mu-crystallin family)